MESIGLNGQVLFNAAAALLLLLLGWWASTVWSMVKELERNLSVCHQALANFREEVAKDRVHRDDFRDALREVKDGQREMKDALNSVAARIFDKLDGKADKHDASR